MKWTKKILNRIFKEERPDFKYLPKFGDLFVLEPTSSDTKLNSDFLNITKGKALLCLSSKSNGRKFSIDFIVINKQNFFSCFSNVKLCSSKEYGYHFCLTEENKFDIMFKKLKGGNIDRLRI